jgi:hypothetical protein
VSGTASTKLRCAPRRLALSKLCCGPRDFIGSLRISTLPPVAQCRRCQSLSAWRSVIEIVGQKVDGDRGAPGRVATTPVSLGRARKVPASCSPSCSACCSGPSLSHALVMRRRGRLDVHPASRSQCNVKLPGAGTHDCHEHRGSAGLAQPAYRNDVGGQVGVNLTCRAHTECRCFRGLGWDRGKCCDTQIAESDQEDRSN